MAVGNSGLPSGSGLSNLLKDTKATTTNLPDWYNSAQQSVSGLAGTAASQSPNWQNTLGQTNVNFLSDPNNPYKTAQGALGTIAQGAANPWNVDASGNVTPNTTTPLGGLFSAQRDQFNQILPNIDAASTAGAIGSGNFGSLRGLTAMGKARGDAYNKLVEQQNQAALQNQQAGATAGAGLGNVTSMNTADLLNAGKWQQAAPYASPTAYANILQTLGQKIPTQSAEQTQLSPLGQLSGLNSTLSNLLGSSTGQLLLSKLDLGGAKTADQLLAKLIGGVTNTSAVPAIDTSKGVVSFGRLLSYGSPVSGTGPGGGAGLGQVQGIDGRVYNDPTYGTGNAYANWGSTINTGPAPEGAVDSTTGLANPGWYQDELGNWTNIGTGQTPAGDGSSETTPNTDTNTDTNTDINTDTNTDTSTDTTSIDTTPVEEP